ncbi:MAG: DUF6345 domain-containing protein [Candidatus Thiodiazotropha sp.]
MEIYQGSIKALSLAICCSALSLPGHASAKELPVYHVVDQGISETQIYQLSDAMMFDAQQIDLELYRRTGALSFIDLKRHQVIPTRILGPGKPDEEQKETVREAIDFETLQTLQPVDADVALHQLETALDKSGLLPETYKPGIRHTRFEAVDRAGKILADTAIDTKADLQLYAGDLPLIGPGAKISATLGSDGGITQFRFANRHLEQGESVPVIDHAQARQTCEARLLDSAMGQEMEKLNLNTQLVYYAPSMELTEVKTIQPHYDCGGTAVVDGEIVNLLHQMIPAVDSSAYVPALELSAQLAGETVTARVNIEGGTPPYAIEWSAASVKPLNRSGTAVSFPLQSRKGGVESQVTVKVTDANGIEKLASVGVAAPKLSAHESSPLLDYLGQALAQVVDVLVPSVEAVGGITDYGTENAVTNQFGDLEQGFIDRMQSAGVIERFSWSGTLAWEQDFKAGEDSNWIDNTDITFYTGHGNGDRFTFEDTTHDDGALDYDDATEDWGDKDLEWLALLSCQVLEDDWAGMSRFDRWKQEFDGLHLLMGFHTNAYAWMSFSGEFADNMLKSSPMTVRTAWFEAVDSDQPSGVVPVVMGVLDVNGMSNVNDYFWGKGSVGPDIRDGDITGYWSIKVL